MSDRNKIASELSAEDLHEFLDKCYRAEGLTLKRVQELAGEHGINVSLMGAKSFRDSTFSRHLRRIEKAGELAAQVAALKQAGAGHTIADAASALLSDAVLDKIVNLDPSEELDLDVMSKIVKRLRDSDSRVIALQHKIEQDRDAAAERVLKDPKLLAEVAAIKKSEGLTDSQKIEKVRRRLWGDAPADFTPHTETRSER